jgi:hypothetical protein
MLLPACLPCSSSRRHLGLVTLAITGPHWRQPIGKRDFTLARRVSSTIWLVAPGQSPTHHVKGRPMPHSPTRGRPGCPARQVRAAAAARLAGRQAGHEQTPTTPAPLWRLRRPLDPPDLLSYDQGGLSAPARRASPACAPARTEPRAGRLARRCSDRGLQLNVTALRVRTEEHITWRSTVVGDLRKCWSAQRWARDSW